MKKGYLFAMVLLPALLGAGCGQKCKKAKDYILEPTYEVQNYLALQPTGANLQKDGCDWILYKFRNLPEGARIVRKIARSRYEHSRSYCTEWDYMWVSRCVNGGRHGGLECVDVPRRYCVNWQTDTRHDPGYADAMNLSAELDSVYAQSQNMCHFARSGQLSDAQTAARFLSRDISERVRPHEDDVYAMACGR